MVQFGDEITQLHNVVNFSKIHPNQTIWLYEWNNETDYNSNNIIMKYDIYSYGLS